MNKSLTFLFLFIIGISSFSDELSDGSKKKLVIRAGIRSFIKESMYLKAVNGTIFFKYGDSVEEIKENQFIKIESRANKIFYQGKNIDEILTARGSLNSITAISKDGKNFRSYRGDFRFISIDNSNDCFFID